MIYGDWPGTPGFFHIAKVMGGKTNQQIADELFITLGTVKWHVHNILQKLGVNNRTQATIRAQELGLL